MIPFILLFLSLTQPTASAERASARSEESTGIYSPVGKRDPFKIPPVDILSRSVATVNQTQKYSIEKMALRAILRASDQAQAMLEDPEGRSFIVREGDIIGRERGTISRILDTEVIVTERTYNYLGAEVLYERILSLPRDEALDLDGSPSQKDTFRAPDKTSTVQATGDSKSPVTSAPAVSPTLPQAPRTNQ